MAAQFGKTVPEPDHAVPSIETLLNAIAEKQAGKGTRMGLRKGSGRSKVRKLLFCVRAAVRERDRRRLQRARSITLHQDGSGKRLVMRFRACDARLRSCTGMAGHRYYLELGTGVEALMKGTQAIIRKLCMPYVGAPYVPLCQRTVVGACADVLRCTACTHLHHGRSLQHGCNHR